MVQKTAFQKSKTQIYLPSQTDKILSAESLDSDEALNYRILQTPKFTCRFRGSFFRLGLNNDKMRPMGYKIRQNKY
jgi:hypothetical protein